MQPRASVIIPVHNAAATLGAQLEALSEQSGAPQFETIVVLNCCTDLSGDVAARYAERLSLRVLEYNQTASAAAARNTGASAANSEVLLFCDADDVVSPDWVREMTKALALGAASAVGGLMQVDRTGLRDWMYRLRYAAADGRSTHPHALVEAYAVSANFGVTAQAFQSVGGFDETMSTAGAEDIDIAVRLRAAGFRVFPVPTASIAYAPRLTLRSMLRQSRAYARGEADLYAKHAVVDDVTILQLVARLGKTAAAAVLINHVFRPSEIIARVMIRYYGEIERRRRRRKSVE